MILCKLQLHFTCLSSTISSKNSSTIWRSSSCGLQIKHSSTKAITNRNIKHTKTITNRNIKHTMVDKLCDCCPTTTVVIQTMLIGSSLCQRFMTLTIFFSHILCFLLTPFSCVFLLAKLLLSCCGWFYRGALSRWFVRSSHWVCDCQSVWSIWLSIRVIHMIVDPYGHMNSLFACTIQIVNPYGFNTVKKQT